MSELSQSVHYAKYALVWECAGCGAREWQNLTGPDCNPTDVAEPEPTECWRCGKPFGEAKDE